MATISKPKSALFLFLIAVGIVGGGYLLKEEREALSELVVSAEVPRDIRVDETVRVPVRLNTRDQIINAFEVFATFDKESLEIEKIDTNGSLARLWIKDQPAFDNEAGTFSLRGGIPQTGFQGNGLLGTVVLRVKQEGTFRITFQDKSRILKHDGKGSTEPVRLDDIVITAR